MNIPEFLSQRITTSPKIIQFAKDGKYEDSWIFSSTDKRPEVGVINEYLNKTPFDQLILEYVWEPNEDSKDMF